MKHSTILYDPSLMSSDPSQQSMFDRYNGLFTPLEISAEAFKAAYDTPDIGPHIEKDYKGLSYLSWPFAYRYLKEHFPTLFVAFEEKTIGEVVFGGPGYYYLRPYLTDGVRRTVAHCLTERANVPLADLTAFPVPQSCFAVVGSAHDHQSPFPRESHTSQLFCFATGHDQPTWLLRALLCYPFITASGVRRATLVAIPAPLTTWTTSSTSL